MVVLRMVFRRVCWGRGRGRCGRGGVLNQGSVWTPGICGYAVRKVDDSEVVAGARTEGGGYFYSDASTRTSPADLATRTPTGE